MDNNLKTKILSIMLVLLMILGIGTMSFAAEEAQEEMEITLNRKVFFTGKTYTLYNGKRVRKEYKDGEEGCGVITIILKNKEFGIYVLGEGWISSEQIAKAEKFIDIDINFDNLFEKGIISKLRVNGEYTKIESDNTGIIEYKDGVLIAKGNGKTDLKITTKDGKTINLLATVVDGGMTLNIPEKSMITEVDADTKIADKVEIDADANGEAVLVIEDGKVGISTKESGTVKVDGKEVVKYEGEEKAEVKMDEEGVEASGEGKQTVTIFEDLKIEAEEKGKVEVNEEEVKVEGEGKVDANEEEVIEIKGEITKEHDEEDPKLDLNVEVKDEEVAKVEDKEIPIVSMFKKLINRLRRR